jgi:GTPase SAR1 family protein
MLVYDVMDPETFTGLQHWLERVDHHAPENVVLMVLGNKRDSLNTEPAVPTAQAQAFATQIGAAFMEVSAKTGSGVNEAFMQIAEEVVLGTPIQPSQLHATPVLTNSYRDRLRLKIASGIAFVVVLIGLSMVL